MIFWTQIARITAFNKITKLENPISADGIAAQKNGYL